MRVLAIIPSWASSFVADMTTPMVRRGFTSLNKVRPVEQAAGLV
jgi:hypothetical protein